MQEFLNKLGKTATAAAGKAGSKAGELMEVGRLRGRIVSKKQSIGTAKKEIGARCYELSKEGKLENPEIIELCEKIDAYKEEIAELEEKIQAVKEEYIEKNEENPTL